MISKIFHIYKKIQNEILCAINKYIKIIEILQQILKKNINYKQRSLHFTRLRKLHSFFMLPTLGGQRIPVDNIKKYGAQIMPLVSTFREGIVSIPDLLKKGFTYYKQIKKTIKKFICRYTWGVDSA